MSTFKLSLPTDIPWRRICVSGDMIDTIGCDDERPPRWRSSMALFRYNPAEEYQPYENEVVSYIKIVATMAPFQPEIEIEDFHGFLPPHLIDEVEESFPCYGAILQVSVTPGTKADKERFSPLNYPYIIDCEPKKRELYEAVTDTGEVLSGSSSALSIGKATTNTHSTENYDLDMGGGGGFNIGFASAAIGGNWHSEEQTGTVGKSSTEVQNIRSTDYSTERRELQSHTTNLTQMYNLFQAFHVGTNRALFLIEPRPHIRQSEAAFINGPRALEGVQEVFLVIVRPKGMKDFCVNALLETAHIGKQPVEDFETKKRVETIRFEAGASEQTFHELYYPDPGFVFDLEKMTGAWFEQKEYYKVIDAYSSPTVDADGQYVEVKIRLAPRGIWSADIQFPMKKLESEVVDYVRSMFLSAREICCCPMEATFLLPEHEEWIASVRDLSQHKWPIYSGPGSSKRFFESRRIASKIRDEMIRSFRSSRRQKRGEVPYRESDVFHTRMMDLLSVSKRDTAKDMSVGKVKGLDDRTRGRIYSEFGDITVNELITKDSTIMARSLKMDLEKVSRLKKRLIREVATGKST